MIRIYCAKADATLLETETLTAGMMNTPNVAFTFSADWDGLGKTAIVRAGTVIKEVIIEENQITIPAECLAKAGVNLIVGVWGGNFVTELPTVWCACGEIQDSTNPSAATNHEEGTPSNVAQMLATMERTEETLNAMQYLVDVAGEVKGIIDEGVDSNAEAWAVGKRNGTNVSSNDVTYHNNSKYYAQQAEYGFDKANEARAAAEAAALRDVPDTVSSWLAANMTNPSDPAIDASLSVAGAASDSLAVGKAVENISRYTNLINYRDYSGITQAGITVTDNENGSITLNGTCTASSATAINLGPTVALEKGETYLITGSDSDFNFESNYSLQARGTSVQYTQNSIGGSLFSAVASETVSIALRVVGGYTFDNVTITPVIIKSEFSTLAEELEAIKDGHTFDNLFRKNYLVNDSYTTNGVTATAENGVITFSGIASTLTGFPLSRNNPIVLKAGHIYKFCSNNQNDVIPSANTFKLGIRLYNDTSTTVQDERNENGFFYIPSTDMFVRLFVTIADSYDMSNIVLKPSVEDLGCSKKNYSDTFNVCAFNIGQFDYGASVEPSGDNDIYRAIIKTLQNAEADILMFCEWNNYWKYDTELSKDVFAELLPYTSHNTRSDAQVYANQNIYSRFQTTYVRFQYYGEGEGYHFLHSVVFIENHCVHLLSTHLPWSYESRRHSDINILLNYIESNGLEYVIIAGDMNLGLDKDNQEDDRHSSMAGRLEITDEDIALFTERGYKSAQGSVWGDPDYHNYINTTETVDVNFPMRCFDNIVISPNMYFKRVWTPPATGASDHLPLCAEIGFM